MTNIESKTCYCKTCERTMDEKQFYTSNRIDKYPADGKLNECKKCITRHVNNWDPSTYKWILEEIDVPYIESEWNVLLEKYGQDRKKITGATILGRYLAKMKLSQYKDFRWADTELIKEKRVNKQTQAMIHQGYSGEEIEEILAKGLTVPEEPPAILAEQSIEAPPPGAMTDFDDDLTDEDRKYLSLKWGRTYRPYEWIQLEQYYRDMMNSFDIQTPSHEDYLKLICKTSLKCHQLIDMGDVEGYQKMSKVYDQLMKSARFTAVQNKEENGEFINSVSELVGLCEKEGGFIPRFYVDQPQDKVDETLRDMRGYTHSLVTEEMNLGNMIESALLALKREAEREEDEDIDDDDLESDVSDADFEEYYNFIEGEQEESAKVVNAFGEEV